MAQSQSLVSLKLDSGDYEAKIKRAQQGLLAMEKECRQVGGTLAILDKEQKDFVKSLGSMETKSTTVKGKIGELTNAYTELRAQYNRLTEEEKKGDYGKTLMGSLNQLKGRINDAKGELKGINGEISGSNGALDMLAGKLGVSTQMFTKLGLAGAAVGAALKVASDAFMSSEENIDTWGRTMEAASATYDSFCMALNNGDISGFLSNIDDIISAAKDAYDALDTLGTMQNLNNPARSKNDAEITRIRSMLRSGKYIVPTDGRPAAAKAGSALTKEQTDYFTKRLNELLGDNRKLTQQEIAQSKKSEAALEREIAAKYGTSVSQVQKYTANYSAFSEGLQNYQKYRDWQDNNGANKWYGTGKVNDDSKNPYKQYKNLSWLADLKTDEEGTTITKLLQQRSATSQMAQGLYSEEAAAFRSEASAANRFKTGHTQSNRGGRSSSTTSKGKKEKMLDGIELFDYSIDTKKKLGGGGSVLGSAADLDRLISAFKTIQSNTTDFDVASKMSEQLIDANNLKLIMQEALDNGISGIDTSGIFAKIFDGENITEDTWQPIIDKLKEALEAQGFSLNIDLDTGAITKVKKESKSMEKSWKDASQAVSSVGSALQQIDDPAAQIMGTIAQAVASVAAGAGQALANHKTMNGWEWVALAAAVTGSMIGTIASIKSATEYHAQGGMVGQNQFIPRGTDTVPAMLTPGEIVLNSAMTSNLASNLQNNNPMSNLHLETEMHAEKLRIMLVNNDRRRGRKAVI